MRYDLTQGLWPRDRLCTCGSGNPHQHGGPYKPTHERGECGGAPGCPWCAAPTKAAPQLLEALKHFVWWTDAYADGPWWQHLTESQRAEYQRGYDLAQAAVAEAEGPPD